MNKSNWSCNNLTKDKKISWLPNRGNSYMRLKHNFSKKQLKNWENLKCKWVSIEKETSKRLLI